MKKNRFIQPAPSNSTLVTYGRDVIGGGVHLGDGDSRFILQLLRQFFVFGRQRLAVAAPGSVKLDQDVALGIVDDFVKVLAHCHFERT